MNGRGTGKNRWRSKGHTLIELMIAIIIGLIMVLASFQVMATFEGHKRTSTAMNDALQSGNFGLYTLDKLERSAGTGLVQSAGVAYGCQLNYTMPSIGVVSNGAIPAALPAPFNGIIAAGQLRVAPTIIFPPATAPTPAAPTSSVLMMMLGAGSGGQMPVPITAPPVATSTIVSNTIGFNANDLVILAKAGAPCMLTNVAAVANNVVLTLGQATVGAASASTFGGGYVVGLGAPTAASFMLYGVDETTYSLRSFDLLNATSGATSQNASDDVLLMQAVYGVDPANTGILRWTPPVAGVVISGTTYDYSPAGLLNGSTGATTALRSIKAVRVGLIMRAPLSEKPGAAVNNGSFTLFTSLPVANQVTWSVPAAGANYRYRVVEGTIPVRNAFY